MTNKHIVGIRDAEESKEKNRKVDYLFLSVFTPPSCEKDG
jgi:hypothetical protein